MKKDALDEMKVDSNSMREAFNLSIDEVVSVLKRKKANTEVTRIASNTLSTYSRIRSTEIHEMALHLMLHRKNMDPKAITEG